MFKLVVNLDLVNTVALETHRGTHTATTKISKQDPAKKPILSLEWMCFLCVCLHLLTLPLCDSS